MTVVDDDFNSQQYANAYQSAQIDVANQIKRISSEIHMIIHYIDEICLGMLCLNFESNCYLNTKLSFSEGMLNKKLEFF